MITGRGVFRDGRIEVYGKPPKEWKNGTEIMLYSETVAITGAVPAEWSRRPQTVAAWVAAYDAIVQAGPAATDEEKWRIARRARTLFDLVSGYERGDRLARLFDDLPEDENPAA